MVLNTHKRNKTLPIITQYSLLIVSNIYGCGTEKLVDINKGSLYFLYKYYFLGPLMLS